MSLAALAISVGVLLGGMLYLLVGFARQKWGAHRHQQQRYGDKHALLNEYLHNERILEAAGRAGLMSPRYRRTVLSKLPDFDESGVDMVLSSLYGSRPVRKAISRFVHQQAGVDRAKHEERMLLFHNKVEASRRAAIGLLEAQRKA